MPMGSRGQLPLHGYQIRWTERWDSPGATTIGERGFRSRAEMEKARAETIKRIGWTPPKWWQWWRWNDSPRSL
jgi:hypothetical protein